jgi:hypothetical protein
MMPRKGPGLPGAYEWQCDLHANDTDVDNCEDSLTPDGQTVIENPLSNESVNTSPLYNSNTNTCW